MAAGIRDPGSLICAAVQRSNFIDECQVLNIQRTKTYTSIQMHRNKDLDVRSFKDYCREYEGANL